VTDTDLQQHDLVLLEKLLEAGGGTITAPMDSRGAPDQASLERLTQLGCKIEHDPRGIRLIESGLGVWSDYLSHALSHPPMRTVEVYQRTRSTQDLVKARADESLVAFADEQTGGRGRLGRSWHAPAGTGLLFSMTHHPNAGQAGSVDRASFLTAVGLVQAIEQLTGCEPIQISWPNDLVVDGRKLAGILVESVRLKNGSTALVIGVGINIGLTEAQLDQMPEDVRRRATSFRLLGWPSDRLNLAARVIDHIGRCLSATELGPLVETWRQRNLYRDQVIRLRANGQAIQGTVMDLDPDNGLILRRDTGEIIHLPAATTSVIN